MAVFSKLVTTENGRALIARMLSGGEKITFTRVCSSDREYDLEKLINLEILEDIRQTGSVSKVSRTNDISVKVETVFTNTELTEGYYIRTVALYARGGEGEEVLYAAAVETSGNCFMPAFGGITVSGAYIRLVTTVSNAENVTLEVDNSVFATIGNIKELQEQIDGISGLVGKMASAVNVNAKKLEMLERIGNRLQVHDLKIAKAIPYDETSETAVITADMVLPRLDNKTYYLYVLEDGDGSFLEMYHEDRNYKRELEGFLWVFLQVGSYTYAQQVVPIAPWVVTDGQCSYVSSVNLMSIYGPPESEGIKLLISPHVYERVDGVLKKIEGNLYIHGNLRLNVYKLGGVLASVEGSGTVDGSTGEGSSGSGTSNYNLLANKPSINNVTLQGNLTSKQLGLEGGSGGTPSMTYEEAMAILNETDEEENET